MTDNNNDETLFTVSQQDNGRLTTTVYERMRDLSLVGTAITVGDAIRVICHGRGFDIRTMTWHVLRELVAPTAEIEMLGANSSGKPVLRQVKTEKQP